jgi:NRAMP (natural resistance-associated macrophage protein)-like metal ion transporter
MTISPVEPAPVGEPGPSGEQSTTADRTGPDPGGDSGASQDSRSPLRRYLAALGPGLVTGASDDDPSGIATYAQAGAQFRYATLWTVLVSLPLMMAVQEICDRTALATGQSLGKLARRRFGDRVRLITVILLVALLIANCLNIAADLMAVGQGMHLLHAGPAPLWSALAGVALMVLLVNGSFGFIAGIFKWLCASLLVYAAVVFAAHVSASGVARGLLGAEVQGGGKYWALIVAILGTTISPYLFFWQTAHRVEEMREETDGDGDDGGGDGNKDAVPLLLRGRRHALRKTRESRVDVFSGMLLSQLVMFAIIAATAATIGQKKNSTISSAADAAQALRPVAGGLSTVLFALGFIGAGMLAIPVLAGAASVGIAGLVGKDWGFDQSPRRAPLFYGLVAVGTVGGTVLALVLSNPIQLLVFVALVNGIAAAPFLIITMLIARDTDIMGEHRNGRLANTLGWVTVAVMGVAGFVGVWQTLIG